MVSWVTYKYKIIDLSVMDDIYINNLIGAVALGYGMSSAAVLSRLDGLYSEARRRNILKGLNSFLLKCYTKHIWKRIARHEKNDKDFSWKTPRWVARLLKNNVPHKSVGE